MTVGEDEQTWAGPAFDQPSQPLTRFIIIAKTPRVGSHLLGRLLWRAGLGVPHEYYNSQYLPTFAQRWGVDRADPSFPARYLEAVVRHRTVGGVCTVSCAPRRFHLLEDGLAACQGLPGPSFVHLWRRDSLAQAISLQLATQSGFWDMTAEPTSPPEPDMDILDLDALRRTIRWLLMGELWWRADLRCRTRSLIHIDYETLIREPQQTLRRIVEALVPDRAAVLGPPAAEPPTPERLWALQVLSADQRRGLYQAYQARFGPLTPLPDP